MLKKIQFSVPVFLALTFWFVPAEAATLYMLPKIGELKAGQSFTLEIKVNTEGNSFNAAQATINFPANLLEVKSVDSSPFASIFGFWLEGPTFSNATGKVSFIGGTTSGISGSSIPILKINFTAKAVGEAPVNFSDAAVTASDGNGTNILTSMEVANFKIFPATAAPVAPAVQTPVPVTIVPQPTLIVRTPVPTGKLPLKPAVSVPFYPDESKWYNFSEDFLAQWNLPADISGVSAVLDKNKTYSGKDSEGLFESKVFPEIRSDGAWYVHVKFRNATGWGPSADYRIAIDTLPPHSFKIDSLSGFRTDNPSPVFRFAASDSLSGIDHYDIKIDGGAAIKNESGELRLPLQAPGKHRISVRAFDKAGNSIEEFADFEILPIKSPVITFVSESVFIGEGGLVISGTSEINTSVLYALYGESGKVIQKGELATDPDGNWQTVMDQPLKKGQYYFEIHARDSRGALSFPVRSVLIKIQERPLLTIAGIEITKSWFFMGLIFILLVSFGIGWYSYKLWVFRVEDKAVIAKRDFSNLLATTIKDLDLINSNLNKKDIEEKDITEAKFNSSKVKQNLQKMEKYLAEEIEEISR